MRIRSGDELGRPSRARWWVDHGGSELEYKVRAEILSSTEGVGAGHSTVERQDNRTWQEGRPRTLVMRAMTEAGRA